MFFRQDVVINFDIAILASAKYVSLLVFGIQYKQIAVILTSKHLYFQLIKLIAC